MQEQVVGVAAPIGSDSRAAARFSTREQNVQAGLNLVKRFKSGRAYVDEASAEVSPEKSPKNKKAKKIDVRDILSNQSESRSDMRSAIINLTSSMKQKEVSSEELSFKKECWSDKKELLQQKLKAKYAYREKQSELEIRKAKLQFLKSDKESALERYKEEDDNELKILHKSEYILLSKAYMNELQSFVSSGKPEKDDRMHASEDDDTNENEAEADYSTSAKKQLSEYDAEAETITNSTRHRSRSAD